VALALVAAFYKELLFTAYDATVAAATGIPTRLMEYGLLALVAVSTVVALQTVGIVLVVSSYARRNGASAPAGAGEPPLDILKRRLAKGEITREEYDAIKKELS